MGIAAGVGVLLGLLVVRR
ncbi:hypothetical protein FLP41_01265 (plasmid) [Paracoccus marcusii]|nr:hypothetical protein FLP41_01265 [Paracoccus marcusii]